MEIELVTRDTTYFEFQTSICFEIDGQEFWFDMVEKGEQQGGKVDVDFFPDEELPFELTEEMKDAMYKIATTQF